MPGLLHPIKSCVLWWWPEVMNYCKMVREYKRESIKQSIKQSRWVSKVNWINWRLFLLFINTCNLTIYFYTKDQKKFKKKNQIPHPFDVLGGNLQEYSAKWVRILRSLKTKENKRTLCPAYAGQRKIAYVSQHKWTMAGIVLWALHIW